MTDEQLLRYSRHILLDALGIEGQERILATHALVIGAGGLGSPAALYLASAGIGKITLVDDDNVNLTNLQRQILHTQSRVGMAKAESGRQALAAINPDIEIVPLQQRLAGAALDALVASVDIVLDCSDNFATRHAINRACVHHRKPLVSGAAIRFAGQISVYDLAHDAAPVLPLPVSRGRGRRGSPLRGDGRFRPADRHHRRHAGRRGAETGRRHRRKSERPPAVARCAGNGLAYRPLQEGRRLYGLRP